MLKWLEKIQCGLGAVVGCKYPAVHLPFPTCPRPMASRPFPPLACRHPDRVRPVRPGSSAAPRCARDSPCLNTAGPGAGSACQWSIATASCVVGNGGTGFWALVGGSLSGEREACGRGNAIKSCRLAAAARTKQNTDAGLKPPCSRPPSIASSLSRDLAGVGAVDGCRTVLAQHAGWPGYGGQLVRLTLA